MLYRCVGSPVRDARRAPSRALFQTPPRAIARDPRRPRADPIPNDASRASTAIPRDRGGAIPPRSPPLHPRGPRSSRPPSIRPRRADPHLSHLPPPVSRQAHAELRPARAHRRRQQGQRAVSRRGRTARETRARAIAPARVSRREERRESDGDGRVAKGSARENARAERGEREHTHLAVPREGPRRASRASSRSERGDMSPSTAPAALVGTTHH